MLNVEHCSQGENTMEGIKTRAVRLYRQLALPNPPLAAPVVHPAWDSPLDWTSPYCTVRTVVSSAGCCMPETHS